LATALVTDPVGTAENALARIRQTHSFDAALSCWAVDAVALAGDAGPFEARLALGAELRAAVRIEAPAVGADFSAGAFDADAEVGGADVADTDLALEAGHAVAVIGVAEPAGAARARRTGHSDAAALEAGVVDADLAVAGAE